ncbi:prolyl oligopeptidase family serine peptidase [Elizabethkingia argentiflava]|uniref:Prolyl oligopeptidase family serine peptidase n=1 Tax=Elizabethkingia argenteiflava TaxID=2681556 RepID=A0A845PTU4_9FLAO|nr:alpha/beta hydrolase [Elizabethkingia argenteiflava]NAW50483.1 prolyl oligopeptidase family serine peptidase [Elizabethkingia argenteiflava]
MRLVILFSMISIFLFSQEGKEKKSEQFINKVFIEKDYKGSLLFFNKKLIEDGYITENILSNAITALGNEYGNLKKFEKIDVQASNIYYKAIFEKVQQYIEISFDQNDEIIGFHVLPNHSIETKDNSNKSMSFGENIIINGNNKEINGTYIENKSSNFLVIIIPGSGSQDRDGTIFSNKPYKDIAEHLYKKGISSYRYDKKIKNEDVQNITIDKEYTNDLLAIISFFNNKGKKIVLIGHSQGGTIVPMIINVSKNNIYKGIIMAGYVSPLQDIILKQINYLNNDNNGNILVQKVKKDIDEINKLDKNIDDFKKKELLSVPTSYWLSLKKYNIQTNLRTINIPLMIMQGGKDYQIGKDEYLKFEKLLKNKNNVSLKFYPDLNHLFMKSDGTMSPEEYKIKSIVNDKVLNDIYDFIVS